MSDRRDEHSRVWRVSWPSARPPSPLRDASPIFPLHFASVSATSDRPYDTENSVSPRMGHPENFITLHKLPFHSIHYSHFKSLQHDSLSSQYKEGSICFHRQYLSASSIFRIMRLPAINQGFSYSSNTNLSFPTHSCCLRGSPMIKGFDFFDNKHTQSYLRDTILDHCVSLTLKALKIKIDLLWSSQSIQFSNEIWFPIELTFEKFHFSR